MKIIIRDELVNNLREQIKTLGVNEVVKIVGGVDTLIKVAFNGDLKTFYEYTGYVPYKFDSTGDNMYIDEMLIQTLNLDDVSNQRYDSGKKLGDFRWTSGGINYKVNTILSSTFKSVNGQELRRVIGRSGDSGFGDAYAGTSNKIGKRGRAQIFKQIIEKYKLNSYFNEDIN
jgi:hypothetical protein